jgi:hypothetical protein
MNCGLTTVATPDLASNLPPSHHNSTMDTKNTNKEEIWQKKQDQKLQLHLDSIAWAQLEVLAKHVRNLRQVYQLYISYS